MLTNTKKDGRIFISYRRSDAKGYAGRLSDSLEEYFGNNRVFRDIEDIKGGAAFGDVIKENIQSADAVIVLIGPTWLSVTGKDNKPRLLDPGDWVAQEITSAIELGIPLFPVLIEQTPMPRQEELPEKLHPILQYNAITISDNSWSNDVLRLGKVLSFDIPSENARKVNFAKKWSSIAIFTTLAFTTCMLFGYFFTFLENPNDNNNTYKAWKDGAPYKIEVLKTIEDLTEQGHKVFKEVKVIGDTVTRFRLLNLEKIESLIYQRNGIDTQKGFYLPLIRINDSLAQEEIDSLNNLGVEVFTKVDFDKLVRQKIELKEIRKNPDNQEIILTQIKLDTLIKSQCKILSKDIRTKVFKAEDLNVPQEFSLLKPWATVPPYMGIFVSLLLIFYIIPLIDKERQKYLFYSIYTGAIGTFIIIVGQFPISNQYEPIWFYFGSIIIATGMLAFMNMSGFKVK